MKKKIFISVCILSFFNGVIYSQNIKRCSTAEKMEEIRASNPDAYDLNKIEKEAILQNWITNHYEEFANTRAILTIPVVVQIFGSAANNAVTDLRVNEQIAVLNADYRRLNSDASSVPSVFTSVAADCEIEFCLANRDENNAVTTGIVRKTSQNQPANNGNDLWNTNQYLNILVYSIGGGTLGFTVTPSNSTDFGVHVGYEYFGKTGATAPYNKGRTATHEVGHWLNLEHIWGDDGTACSGTDFCTDTPNQADENYGNPSFPQVSCSNSGDMHMNYMDYVDDAAMYMFTANQKARMIAAINTFRPGLLNNGKCVSQVMPVASFNSNQTSICQNNSITFTSTSTGMPTSYAWSFPGGNPSTSTLSSPTVTYGIAGVYNATLTVTNAQGSDSEVLTNGITINNCASISEEVEKAFRIYPNPANEEIQIELTNLTLESKVEVVDINGKIILAKDLVSFNETINLSNIQTGMYFIKLFQANTVCIEKIEIKK